MIRRAAALSSVALVLAGCSLDEGGSRSPGVVTRVMPWSFEPLPKAPEPPDNPSSPEKIELGRMLFYDPVLSTDREVACATCHSEIWGMSDGLPRSIGIGGKGPTGPGRTGPLARRNAQTLWNSAHRESLFWDGRVTSLEEQVLGPLHDATELGRDPEEVVAELSTIPGYRALFEAAFPGEGEPVTVVHLQRAIAAFERALVSDRAPYDQFAKGDTGALGDEAQRGMWLFAEVGCASCHTPPRFESDRFADREVPRSRDTGRAGVTRDSADHGSFRVPTLRNIRETSPYFHDGSVTSLRDAVAHEASLAPRALDDGEVDAIVTFLDKGLTDPSRSPGRPAEVPSGLTVPADGFRIPR